MKDNLNFVLIPLALSLAPYFKESDDSMLSHQQNDFFRANFEVSLFTFSHPINATSVLNTIFSNLQASSIATRDTMLVSFNRSSLPIPSIKSLTMSWSVTNVTWNARLRDCPPKKRKRKWNAENVLPLWKLLQRHLVSV